MEIKFKNSTASKFDERLDRLKNNANYDVYEILWERFEFHPPNSHFTSIRYEIRDALCFGLHQAALMLINHYLEKFLKVSIIHKEIDMMMVDLEAYNLKSNEVTKKYAGIGLGKSIEKAFDIGLIDSDEKDQLKEFKDVFRNPFSHSDMNSTFKGQTTNLHMFSFSNPTEEIQKITMDVANFIPFQDGRQQEIAKEVAFAYFIYIDDLYIRSEIRGYKNWADIQPNKDIDFEKLFGVV